MVLTAWEAGTAVKTGEPASVVEAVKVPLTGWFAGVMTVVVGRPAITGATGSQMTVTGNVIVLLAKLG
jgi:hypothetical protein